MASASMSPEIWHFLRKMEMELSWREEKMPGEESEGEMALLAAEEEAKSL